MKKLFLFLAIVISLFSQAQKWTGDKIDVRERITMMGVPIDSVRKDTAGWNGANKSLATADAVYKFVKGRISSIPVINFSDSAWVPGGNAGTNPSTKFIGTKDAQDFAIRTNNVEAARFGSNGYFGISVTPTAKLHIKTDGIAVTQSNAYGILLENTTATNAITTVQMPPGIVLKGRAYTPAFGGQDQSQAWRIDVLPSSPVSSVNTGSYFLLGRSINGSAYTTFLKMGSLYSNATNNLDILQLVPTYFGTINGGTSLGTYGGNLYYGSYPLSGTALAATGNTAVGSASQSQTNIGSYCTSTGAQSLFSNTDGSFNTAHGYFALHDNTTGEQNTASGANALLHNTTGIKNTADGAGCLENNTTGSFNYAAHHDALLSNTDGFRNIGIGWNAGANIAHGFHNIFVGYGAGKSITDGHDNTVIGGFSTSWNGLQLTDMRHSIVIGSYAYANKNYQTVLGSDSTQETYIAGNVGIGTRDPLEKLHVVGNIRFSGALMPNGDAGTVGQVLTSAGAGAPPTWTTISAPRIVASADSVGKTGSVGVVVAYTPLSADGTFRVGCYLTSTAISSGTINVQVSYTDETNTIRLQTFAIMGTTTQNITTTGGFVFPDIQFRAKANNAITVSTVFTGTSTTYNIGATIEQLR